MVLRWCFFNFFQQIFVGFSTYFIGIAGESIVNSQENVIKYIILFFSLIVLAYIFGAASLIARTKLANESWRNYYNDVFNKLSFNPYLSSEKNKVTTNAWIGGEALSTLNEASFFLLK